eukprot:CAMPEP_0197017112 /NCGR_PEP_ID=MMETSP1380-20130617/79359_1 /TAXON_ID=5936 /ORGANISM="Euplotes crassus, Strain CT5" /LENGTH=100 /DNA_ID=CAMNT_0042444171 /DNA_START=680 /DNA_END=979 /DNA_ORIENTATION=+
MNNESGQDSDYSSIFGLEKEEKKTLLKSYDCEQPLLDLAQKSNNESIKLNSEKLPINPHTPQFNSKEPHQGSVLKMDEKVKHLNFVKLNQRVIGFRTRFA